MNKIDSFWAAAAAEPLRQGPQLPQLFSVQPPAVVHSQAPVGRYGSGMGLSQLIIVVLAISLQLAVLAASDEVGGHNWRLGAHALRCAPWQLSLDHLGSACVN